MVYLLSNLNIFISNYRPQRSCEGYVFTRVRDSVHRGGVLSQHALQQGGLLWGGVPVPGGVCSRGGLLPGGVPALGGLLPGGVPAPGGSVEPLPRKQTATVADGTHPTGMHSCLRMI